MKERSSVYYVSLNHKTGYSIKNKTEKWAGLIIKE